MVWATKGHNLCILGDKRFINAKQTELIHKSWYVVASPCVLVAKETDDIGNAQIILEQACKKGVSMCVAKLSLVLPGRVVLGEPEEVVVL